MYQILLHEKSPPQDFGRNLPNEAGKRWKASDCVRPNMTSYLAKVLVWPFWLKMSSHMYQILLHIKSPPQDFGRNLPNEAGKRWKASDCVRPNMTSYLAKVLVWPFWLKMSNGWSGMTTPSTMGPKGVVYMGTFSYKRVKKNKFTYILGQ